MTKAAKAAKKTAKPAERKAAKSDASVLKGGASLKEFSPGRWAIIMKVDDRDSREEVIDIKQMAPGAKPELAADNQNPDNYAIEQVPDSVIIGMRRGGKFEAADGFGWRDAEDKAARGSPIGAGQTRLTDAKAA